MNRKIYNVVIVGAGPAGLFAALELREKGVKNIALLEKGPPIEARERKQVMFGVGGAGLYSDGKLILSPSYGKTNILEFVSRSEGEEIVKKIEAVFRAVGVKEKAYPRNMRRALDLKNRCQRQGIDMLLVRQLHLGSDRGVVYIKTLAQKLRKIGVKIFAETEVVSFKKKGKKLAAAVTCQGEEVRGHYFLVAPGRAGNIWLTQEAQKLGLNLEYRPIEVGVRVETTKEILHDVCQIIYEPALVFYTQTYDDYVRTFCVVPNGFVVKEKYKDFISLNGHAYKNKFSPNGNFALLVKVNLSEPVTDTISYGESICHLANTIGAGRPLLQRYGDFRRRRRSTWVRLKKSFVIPTLTEVTPGDISMALPYRVVADLEEGMEKINKIIPGVASDATLLYAPEVKFYSARLEVNNFLQTKINNFFVAGDGAGVSGNIVGAAATGIIAARGIAFSLKKH